MNRGNIGVLPRPTSLADESYLEFVTSFRKFAIQQMFPIVAAEGEAALEAAMASGAVARPAAGEVVPLDDIKRVFSAIPVVPTWQRFVRSQQEMMWRRTRESFVGDADAMMQRMAAAEAGNPDGLMVDRDFVVPDYATREIHCQPGGYVKDPIAGIVYHYGTKIFYEGMNDQDELHIELAQKATLPADGKVGRILDIGCSIGQATTVLKDLHPSAEVWGLDVGLPMLRYAHMRATEQGSDVIFKQGLAETTGFADAHFDMVVSYILFHEVPIPVLQAIAAEMHRILRPGGSFVIYEFPNNDKGQVPPAYRFMIDYDSRDNCEPYSPAFVACDFKGMLEAAGFVVTAGPALTNPFLQSLVATRV